MGRDPNRDREPTAAAGALCGVRVLDFTMIIAGPYTTRLMADLGAEVIKVEPETGDLARGSSARRQGKSTFFAQLNCGKRSLSLDLKRPEAVALLLDLAAHADVIVENFRPGVMERLGLGYERVRERRPDIVYCSISGFGQTGPDAGRAAYAPIIQALSGYDLAQLSYLERAEKPLQGANATADYLSATHALAAINAALFRRARTGRGERIDIALLQVMHNMLAHEIQSAQFPQPFGRTIYKPLRAKDGFVMVAPVSPKNWSDLLRAVGHPEWREQFPLDTRERPLYWARLMEALESWTEQRTAQECEDLISAAGCPCARYRTALESLELPQIAARGAVVEVDDGAGPFRVPNTPLVLRESESRLRPSVPERGGDTRSILREVLGLRPTEIDALLEARIAFE
jgi:crotonobetainyl-CoA:carnitine CoA-transferase CaiB-like acyl-CoA transferase